MEKEFVSYELALKLKELECDITTLAYYDNKGVFYPMGTVCTWESIHFGEFIPKYQYAEGLEILVSAPLWQQALDFMIEKHNLVGTIYANASGYLWEIHDSAPEGGTHRAESGYDGDCQYSGTYTTYHKAREACLIKLIEICAKK